jgi:hypothetical protein
VGIDVQVCKERGEIIEQILDVTKSVKRLMQRAAVAEFPYLRHVDPYGDTYFNRLQLDEVVPELEELMPLTETAEDRSGLTEVLRLARLAKGDVHLYLKLRGD